MKLINLMKKILVIILFLAIAGLIGFQLVQNKAELDAANVVTDRSNKAITVQIHQVDSIEISNGFALPATLIPFEQADIPAAASGKISSLNIELGTYVTKNQVIGQIEHEELNQKLQAAKLVIKQLSEDYERQKILVEGNATNSNALTDAKYDLDNKALEIAQLESQLENTKIITPVNGTITDKQLLEGEYAVTGATIATVTDVHQLKAEIYVPENKIFSLQKGTELIITSEVFPTEKFSGTINYISPQGDENHNYLVQLLISNHASKLKAGQYVQVHFQNDEYKKALQIPQNALVDGFKNPYVFVVNGDKVSEQKLVLGKESGDYVEVISGLTKGEQVVVNGQINLVDGSLIQVIK